jgi:hypothetical protein
MYLNNSFLLWNSTSLRAFKFLSDLLEISSTLKPSSAYSKRLQKSFDAIYQGNRVRVWNLKFSIGYTIHLVRLGYLKAYSNRPYPVFEYPIRMRVYGIQRNFCRLLWHVEANYFTEDVKVKSLKLCRLFFPLGEKNNENLENLKNFENLGKIGKFRKNWKFRKKF